MPQGHRSAPRIEPPCPITVAIAREDGTVVAYGVVADISRSGGCIWTDVLPEVGTTVHLRLSFTRPTELHALAGSVAWASADAGEAGADACRCGLTWLDVGNTLRQRLRQLVNSAIPTSRSELYVFANRWVVPDQGHPQRQTEPATHAGCGGCGSARVDDTVTLPPVVTAQQSR